MKVKDSVYYYEIRFDFIKNTVSQIREEYKVIGVNKSRVCINDDTFTSIKHKKSYRGDNDILFNEVNVYDYHYASYWDDIVGYVYTSSSSNKIAYKRIKRAMEKHIYKKHGRYCNAITLLDQIKI